MGKHEIGYARVERDFYPTPNWVTAELAGIIDIRSESIWEMACGDGRMSEALKAAGADVFSSDVMDRGYTSLDALIDFVADPPSNLQFDGLITNPPYGLRKTGLDHIRRGRARFLALLLPADFDSAKTRAPLFDDPLFSGKIVLRRRIMWFANPTNPNMTPKENSAWLVWGDAGIATPRAPVLLYTPATSATAIAPTLESGVMLPVATVEAAP
jgi:hypothetical protein